ncbi:MAG TPA: poly(R)-hydroxyalkanoic acid synthase subunit PhaE, partial [Beijerinckiaceae bacterium]|nr:poly(R)-hydroxyalkanoic acid synthase subunit PhaE [Beijerinckiaceae bacterium]
ESYGEMFGHPTRAELDDVHKTVTELRRELRALKRQMRSAAPRGQQPIGA